MNIDTNGFELGDTVRDPTTGLEGQVIAMTQWLTGCPRAVVQQRIGADGKVPDSVSVDVLILEMVTAGPRRAPAEVTKGGPRPTPSRR